MEPIKEVNKQGSLFECICEILKGIDKTDSDSKDGWWETSTGAEFGASKLDEIKTLMLNYAKNKNSSDTLKP